MTVALGEQLRQARLQQQLTLEDVAHLTKIPVNRLTDLEACRYTTHGGLVYAKSFLRCYATFLHIDASSTLGKLQVPITSLITDGRTYSSLYVQPEKGLQMRPHPPSAFSLYSLIALSLVFTVSFWWVQGYQNSVSPSDSAISLVPTAAKVVYLPVPQETVPLQFTTTHPHSKGQVLKAVAVEELPLP